MKHHRKSNNGVFSKKQKRASRHMMRNRMSHSVATGSGSLDFAPIDNGILSSILGLILGRRFGRRG